MGEFTKNKFNAYLSKHGIQHQNIIPYTPQRNRVGKRKNKTLVEMARCMFYSKDYINAFGMNLFVMLTIPWIESLIK